MRYNENMLKDKECLDDLQIEGLEIIQNDEKFKFGTDAVLLSHYARIKRGGRCADLGTGTGIIPLLLWAKYRPSEIVGMEIQRELCEMASRSVAHNNLSDTVKIINGDIRDIKDRLTGGIYDNVVSR